MPDVKVVILCGGRGERMGELTAERPKPMIEIGGKPILRHLMGHYAQHGFTHFILALGYLGWVVREYAAADLPWWVVQQEQTGWATQNGGRIKRLTPYLTGGTFLMSWCDGLSDIDLTAMLAFHRRHGKLCTVAVVHPPGRFGVIEISGDLVTAVWEKAPGIEWINAGFFVCEPGVLDYIAGNDSQWEREPMARLAADGQLMAFTHTGFWQCMDTPRDRDALEKVWASGQAPWAFREER